MNIFTNNRKTILSVDFHRNSCKNICSYCYVDTLERIYPAYKKKLETNYNKALTDPESFATSLNEEYKKALQSKSKKYSRLNKLPIRIYGSGDFIPVHKKFLEKLTFKYFIISKTLTLKSTDAIRKELLNINNLQSLVLSFDNDNINNYSNVSHLFKSNKVKFSFTGTNEDINRHKASGLKFNIFFNIDKKQSSIKLARNHKEQCPCDTKLIKSDEACTYCNKCWR